MMTATKIRKKETVKGYRVSWKFRGGVKASRVFTPANGFALAEARADLDGHLQAGATGNITPAYRISI